MSEEHLIHCAALALESRLSAAAGGTENAMLCVQGQQLTAGKGFCCVQCSGVGSISQQQTPHSGTAVKQQAFTLTVVTLLLLPLLLSCAVQCARVGFMSQQQMQPAVSVVK